MSQTNFAITPMIGSRVASTAPFDYNDAMTLLQKVEALRLTLNQLIADENANADAYNALVKQVSDYVAQSLSGVNSMTADYDAKLQAMTDALAKINSMFTNDQADLDTAVQNASNAINTANQLAATYNTTTASLQTGMDALNASVVNKVDKATLAFNVKDYGAKGDGATDDTTAIIACAQAAGQGGRVFFPDGDYVISANIPMPSAQWWEGTSNEMGGNGDALPTRITYTGTGDAVTLGTGGGMERLHIAGPGGTVAGSRGIVIPAHRSSYTLRDVNVSDFETGIYVNLAWYGMMDRPFVTGCSTAINFDYCYNQVVLAPRLSCTPTIDNVARDGIVLNAQSMVTMLGGSIEAFQRAVVLTGGTSFTGTGGYLETQTGKNATGITFSGASNSAILMGWQVYMENLHFVHIPANSGDRLYSVGHHFKGGNAQSWDTCYFWEYPNSKAMRFFILNDEAMSLTGGVHFIPPNTPMPSSCTLFPPYGVTTDGGDLYDSTIYTTATMEFAGTAALGIPSGTAFPNMSAYGNREGAMFYRTDLNKPYFYDAGSNVWRDSTGATA